MMARVIRTSIAERDLADIWDYLAARNLDAADRVVREIGHRCQGLAEYPMSGRERSDLEPRLRSIPVGNYIIFCRPLDDGIEVRRILHAARDLDALF